MTRLTFGSLFAGIGGFDLGFERAGMRCLWQVEKDPYCQKVLAKHWPDVERFEDVREVGKHNLTPIDVICGGFPCQPHSLAGKRKGAEDDRDLWPEYRRIIAELRPAYVIGENVPGIRTTILDQVLSDLENLVYATATFIIPACALDAPHRRDRVFIVAYSTISNAWQSSKWQRREGFNGRGFNRRRNAEEGELSVAHALRTGLEGANHTGTIRAGKWSVQFPEHNGWAVESGVGRVVDGVPHRVDRLRSLGNAVVPQVAEFIGRLVVQHYNERKHERRAESYDNFDR